VREFLADKSKITCEVRSFYPPAFEQLDCAQRESREQKERGWLRPLCRCDRVRDWQSDSAGSCPNEGGGKAQVARSRSPRVSHASGAGGSDLGHGDDLLLSAKSM
jgi:hypothetical protein